MVCIEDLMEEGFTKRKIQDTAIELGFGKSNQYSQEQLVAIRQELCADESEPKRQPGYTNAYSAASEEYAEAAQQDLKDVQLAAENRAAGLLVGLDTLTMLHCATRKFTNPELQEKVNESQQRVRQVLTGVSAFYEPEYFLSQTPLGQIQDSQTGANGSISSTRSLGGSGDELELSDVEIV